VTLEAEHQWKRFEEAGEETVRRNIAANVYGEDRLKLATQWLDHKAQLRSDDDRRRSSELICEQMRIAREANTIARTAATAAIAAAVIATVGVIVSIVALYRSQS